MVDYQFKIILIGPGSVGKTSLLNRFINNQFESSYKMTMGVDLLTKQIDLDGKEVNLNLWDVGGQERFKFMRQSFYKGTSGALLIFDLTRANTYETLVNKWHPEMIKFIGHSIPFILVGNKVDLLPDVGNVIDSDKVTEFADSNFSIYIQTSAKTGEKVEDAFLDLTKRMIPKNQ